MIASDSRSARWHRGRQRGCVLWLWAALLMVLSAPVFAAERERIEVEARREGNAVLVEAGALLKADLAIAWDVITGYDRYAEFIPDLKLSRVLARSGNAVIVEQKGEAGFFLFHFPMEVVLAVVEQPRSSITSQVVSGTFKEMTGSYVLAVQEDGLRFSYTGRLVPNFSLPPLLGTVAVKSAVYKQFKALVQEIQRRAATESP